MLLCIVNTEQYIYSFLVDKRTGNEYFGDHMTDNRHILNTIGRFFKNFLVLVLMIVVIVAAVGVFIYVLYRIAVFSTSLYSFVFVIVLAGSLLFFVIRSVKRVRFDKAKSRTVKFLIHAGLILFIIAALALYGAFFVRYPVPGLIATPMLIVIIGFAGIKWKVFSFCRKFLKNL